MIHAVDGVSIELCILDPKLAKEEGESGHISIRTAMEEKLKTRQHKANIWWNTFFILSCAFAVFLDPTFCYVNAIDDEHKCIVKDNDLQMIYILSLTFTDVLYLIDLVISKCRCFRRKTSCKRRFSDLTSIISRIYICLPITQVLGSGLYMYGSATPIGLFILAAVQYAVRIYNIYVWLKRRPIIDMTGVERWLQPILSFIPFILASHLFGAFWYVLATQRQIFCWLSTRSQVIKRTDSIFYDSLAINLQRYVKCDSNRNQTYPKGSNISLWNDLCPVKQANPNTFDFGVYLYALQSNVTSSTYPIPQRMFQSFWWALRNLSSFGANLNSSMDITEIFFSVMISVGGMTLFIVYLNARVQELRERSNKFLLKEKTQSMKPDIDLWLSNNGIPKGMKAVTKNKKDLKTVIMENIHKLEENTDFDVDVQNILCILPIKDKRSIMCFIFLASAKKVSVLENINEKVLKAICQHLIPVTYAEDSYIVQEGKPLGKMILITRGIAVTYSHGGTSCGSFNNKWLKKGDFYGEELLNWAFKSPSFLDLPISTRNVVAQEKVEAFAIRACDLKSVFFKFWWLFSREVEVSQLEQWKHLAASSIWATWRHRQASSIRTRLAASYVQPTSWLRRRTKTTGPTHWNRFVVN